MNIIRVDNIIATYFNQNPDKNKLTWKTIYKIKKKLEDIFRNQGKPIYIDNTRGTLLDVLLTNADIFEEEKNEKHETTIKLINREKFDETFRRYFDARLESEIKPTYLQLVELFKEPIK